MAVEIINEFITKQKKNPDNDSFFNFQTHLEEQGKSRQLKSNRLRSIVTGYY
jgi:hypothetical protein